MFNVIRKRNRYLDAGGSGPKTKVSQGPTSDEAFSRYQRLDKANEEDSMPVEKKAPMGHKLESYTDYIETKKVKEPPSEPGGLVKKADFGGDAQPTDIGGAIKGGTGSAPAIQPGANTGGILSDQEIANSHKAIRDHYKALEEAGRK